MTVRLHTELDRHVVVIHASDKLTKKDYHHFTRMVDRLIEEHGSLRIVFVMKNFEGWEPEALWEDIKFDIRHFGKIERLAMVGDSQWEKGIDLFCKPFTSSRIRYFGAEEMDRAQVWIHAETDTDDAETSLE